MKSLLIKARPRLATSFLCPTKTHAEGGHALLALGSRSRHVLESVSMLHGLPRRLLCASVLMTAIALLDDEPPWTMRQSEWTLGHEQ